MCDNDRDRPTELERDWRKARKEHACCACRETIRRGDSYHYFAGIYDGDLSAFKHCARCYAICEALWAEGAESVDWELNCGETWEENFGPVPEDVAALAFLTPDEAQERVAGHSQRRSR